MLCQDIIFYKNTEKKELEANNAKWNEFLNKGFGDSFH